MASNEENCDCPKCRHLDSINSVKTDVSEFYDVEE